MRVDPKFQPEPQERVRSNDITDITMFGLRCVNGANNLLKELI